MYVSVQSSMIQKPQSSSVLDVTCNLTLVENSNYVLSLHPGQLSIFLQQRILFSLDTPLDSLSLNSNQALTSDLTCNIHEIMFPENKALIVERKHSLKAYQRSFLLSECNNVSSFPSRIQFQNFDRSTAYPLLSVGVRRNENDTKRKQWIVSALQWKLKNYFLMERLLPFSSALKHFTPVSTCTVTELLLWDHLEYDHAEKNPANDLHWAAAEKTLVTQISFNHVQCFLVRTVKTERKKR